MIALEDRGAISIFGGANSLTQKQHKDKDTKNKAGTK